MGKEIQSKIADSTLVGRVESVFGTNWPLEKLRDTDTNQLITTTDPPHIFPRPGILMGVRAGTIPTIFFAPAHQLNPSIGSLSL
jgi:hypothetical protein